MTDAVSMEKRRTGEAALDGISVAPPLADAETPPVAEVREAKDKEHVAKLKRDPTHADSKLEIALDESFPTSDPPAASRPGSGDPAPSSGFDEAAEAAIARDRRAGK